jgi:hypothetical protein
LLSGCCGFCCCAAHATAARASTSRHVRARMASAAQLFSGLNRCLL